MSPARFPWSYRDVFYPNVSVAADQASAMKLLAPTTLVIVGGGQLLKSVKFHCPCGCGEVLSINLVRATGRAWRMGFDERRGVSLYPSVWRDTGCESHFILRYNTARLLQQRIPELGEEDIERVWRDD